MPGEQPRYYEAMHQQKKEYMRFRLLGRNTFNIQFEIHFKDLDREVLEETIDRLFERHESLRTAFRQHDGKIEQYVYPSKPPGFEIEYIDLLGLEDKDEMIDEIYRKSSATRFDFERGPLVGIKVARYEERLSGMLFTIHHVISDGRSIDILKKEILALYEAGREGQEDPLPPVKWQYRDYGSWVNDFLESKGGAECREFYENRILESLAGENLHPGGDPGDGHMAPRSYKKELERDLLKCLGMKDERLVGEALGSIVHLYPEPGGCYRTYIKKDLLNKLEKLAVECNTTLFMVLIATFAILFRKVKERKNIRMYIPVTTRVLEEFEDIVGWLIGELIVCIKVDDDRNCNDLVTTVTNIFLETGNYRLYPHERIMKDLDLPLSVLAPVFINFGETIDEDIQDLRPVHAGKGSGHFDFKCVIYEYKNCLALTIDYNLNAYTPADIEYIMKEYLAILDSGIFDPKYTLKHFLNN